MNKRDSDPKFYCEYFNSERGRAAFKEIKTGTTMKHLNCGDMKQLLLPSPTAQEQAAIAAILTDMDAELALLEQRQAKTLALKQGIIQELLTGRTRLVTREDAQNAKGGYSSNGSVQVMLFADRLEVWNPGRLPGSLTIARLRETHGSVPHNPLLAEPLYLTQYIERLGTGTGDIIRRCREQGLKEPDFAITDGFTLTIWRVAGAVTSGKTSGKTPARIVALMRDNPEITIPEIAQKLRRTTRAIELQIHDLRQQEIIGHIGPANGGRWEVFE